MIGPLIMSVARAAAPSLTRLFAQHAVTAAATAIGTAVVGGAIQAGKKICQNSQMKQYNCIKCGMEVLGMPGTYTNCPRCGQRLRLN